MRYLLIVCLLLAGCEGKKQKQEGKNTEKENVVQSFDKSGKVTKEITMENGKKNGIAKTFYSNGNVNLEINYKDNLKNGISRRYYESGKLYQESEFRDGQQVGIQKKFDEEGKLLSVARFEEGEPCSGLKEYLDDGSERKSFPSIVITPVNRLLTDGVYILVVTLSDKSKRVNFYKGRLTKGGCLGNSLVPLAGDKKKGEGEIRYFLGQGQYVMEELNIVAEIKTRYGNSYLTQRSYNVAIDNK